MTRLPPREVTPQASSISNRAVQSPCHIELIRSADAG